MKLEGVDYTLNMGIGRFQALEIEITSDVDIIWPAYIVTNQRNTAQVVKKIIYRWNLDFSQSKTNYHINEDKIVYKYDIYNTERGNLDRRSLNKNPKIGMREFLKLPHLFCIVNVDQARSKSLLLRLDV